MKRILLALSVVALLVLGVSPVLAQSSLEFTPTVNRTCDGFTVSWDAANYPEFTYVDVSVSYGDDGDEWLYHIEDGEAIGGSASGLQYGYYYNFTVVVGTDSNFLGPFTTIDQLDGSGPSGAKLTGTYNQPESCSAGTTTTTQSTTTTTVAATTSTTTTTAPTTTTAAPTTTTTAVPPPAPSTTETTTGATTTVTVTASTTTEASTTTVASSTTKAPTTTVVSASETTTTAAPATTATTAAPATTAAATTTTATPATGATPSGVNRTIIVLAGVLAGFVLAFGLRALTKR